MRARTWISCCVTLSLLSLFPLKLRAAEMPVCGDNDLLFGCTKIEEKGRLRAGCGVHDAKRFFASEWRIYDLQTEDVLKKVAAGSEGIALVEIPKDVHWFILEGELVCTSASGQVAIPYRFLGERTGGSFRQHAYSPESLQATGNWNADTQLHYGAFRSRSIVGEPSR